MFGFVFLLFLLDVVVLGFWLLLLSVVFVLV